MMNHIPTTTDGQLTLAILCGFVLLFGIWSLVRLLLEKPAGTRWAEQITEAHRHNEDASSRAVAARRKRIADARIERDFGEVVKQRK